jgi:hypothetical protein
MINKNRFLKVFSLTLAAMALTMGSNAKADATVAADTLESAGNVSDTLNIQASVQSRLAINLMQAGLSPAPFGVTRTAGEDSISFDHPDSAKKALPMTEVSTINLVSNDNEGYEVRACSDYGGRLISSVAEITGSAVDENQEVPYSLEVSEGEQIGEGLLVSCSAAGVVTQEVGSLLIDGSGTPYENSLVALDEAGTETLDTARTLSIAWSENVARAADTYQDNIHVKIFGLVFE